MKKFLLLFLLFMSLYGKDDLFFLPKDGKQAEKKMVYLFSHANQNIKIAIYTFTNKKFARAIKKAAARGIDVYIIADYESNKNQKHGSVIPILKKLRHINVKLINGAGSNKYKGIMHMKLFIVDDIYVGFGSANYTYSAFHKNYEILYINDDWTFTKKFVDIFNQLYSMQRFKF